jgi:hypothetical protein
VWRLLVVCVAPQTETRQAADTEPTFFETLWTRRAAYSIRSASTSPFADYIVLTLTEISHHDPGFR